MKTRLPTTEERRLWREANRHTATRTPDHAAPECDDASEPIVMPPSASPPPRPQPTALRPLSPLSPLATREANRVFRVHPVDATLDLHGATKLEAFARVQQFIVHQHAARRRHVMIITGKGKGGEVGVLRANLAHWLNEPALRPLISAFGHARPEKGGAGVMHVLLKAR